jgi:hypothetical protein
MNAISSICNLSADHSAVVKLSFELTVATVSLDLLRFTSSPSMATSARLDPLWGTINGQGRLQGRRYGGTTKGRGDYKGEGMGATEVGEAVGTVVAILVAEGGGSW